MIATGDTTYSSYRRVAQRMKQELTNVEQRPDVSRAVERYRAAIKSVKSVDAFMASEDVYSLALKSVGLEEAIYAKALIRKVLTEGVDNPKSLANRMTDPRFRELAETFNFARYGSTATTFERTREGTVQRYLRLAVEESAGAQNEGVRLALYFQRKASGVRSPYMLLADRALLRVTQVALGLPQESSRLDVDKQADLIKKKLPVADLRDPQKVDRILQRFSALWDVEQRPAPVNLAMPSAGNQNGASAAIGIIQNILGER